VEETATELKWTKLNEKLLNEKLARREDDFKIKTMKFQRKIK